MLPHNLLILASNQGNIDEQLVNAQKVTEMEGKKCQAFKIVRGADFIQVSDTGRTLQFNEDIQYAEYWKKGA